MVVHLLSRYGNEKRAAALVDYCPVIFSDAVYRKGLVFQGGTKGSVVYSNDGIRGTEKRCKEGNVCLPHLALILLSLPSCRHTAHCFGTRMRPSSFERLIRRKLQSPFLALPNKDRQTSDKPNDKPMVNQGSYFYELKAY